MSEELTYPDDVRYTTDHEWLKKKGDTYTVGVTAFAAEQLGDVVFVELPEVGTEITAGEPFGVVESTKAVSELFAPCSGKVVERNDPLIEAPEAINEDPYEEGWMIRVEPSNPAELEKLMDRETYVGTLEDQEE